jgi:hypothetical protein
MAAAKRVDDTISLEEIKEGLAFELKPEPKTRTRKQPTRKAAPKSGTIGRFKFKVK